MAYLNDPEGTRLPIKLDSTSNGEFEPILTWLQQKIYRQGRKFPPKQLVQMVTGKPMGAADYVEGLGQKYREIYGLDRETANV